MSASCDISKLIASLQPHSELYRKTMEAGRKAVQQAGLHILGEAQKLAPVDTGALKASADWEDAEIQGNQIKMTIGFGVEYAVFVHERLDLHHKQGQAKFLEAALRQGQVRFTRYVAEKMREVK